MIGEYQDYFRKSTFDKVTGKIKEGIIMYIFVEVVTFLFMWLIARPLIFLYTGVICFFSWLSKKVIPESDLEKYFKLEVYKSSIKEEKDKAKVERKLIQDYQSAYKNWKAEADDPKNLPSFEQLAIDWEEEKRRRGEI